MTEVNDIVLWVTSEKPDELNLDAPSDTKLTQVSKYVYDLECEQGMFRLTFQGPDYLPDKFVQDKLPKAGSDFSIAARCLTMTKDCKDRGLWFVRSLIYPKGLEDDKRFEIFEEETKNGIVTGSIGESGENYLTLFDKDGKLSVLIFVLTPKANSWNELASRLVLQMKEAKVDEAAGDTLR